VIITLTTDFGADSGYVGQVKGVLLTRAPEAQLVDLSHGIPAFDVGAAAMLLEDCATAFPHGTTHLAVVDPGVGTQRRAVAVEWKGQRFIGPDNGIFEPFLDTGAVHVIQRREIFRHPVSDVFHGRDLFAPAAAFLAKGALPAELGPPLEDPIRLKWPEIEWEPQRLRAPVLRADSFGNLQTRLRREFLPADEEPRVRLEKQSGEKVELPLRRAYGDVERGQMVALWGSNGRLEVAVAQGSAAKQLQFAPAEIWVEVAWG
jgi:S-adenosyl-L-methionine hydrolase (adenosine-forming)